MELYEQVPLWKLVVSKLDVALICTRERIALSSSNQIPKFLEVLYLNSTPATKFYLDTNILAIEAFTNRLSHVHVSIAGLHTYIATSNNQVSKTLFLYRKKCVSPKIARVLRLMAVEGMSFQAALRDLDGQQYLFQIRITPYNFTPRHRTFTVSAISDDICSSNSVRGGK